MKKISGFTLVELMITLVVAVILVTVAIPGFRSIIQNNRATTQSNELLTAFTLARSEAIKRFTTVTVCSSTDQATCSGNTNWATGWIVFIDRPNGSGNFGTFEDDGDTTLCETDASNVPTEDCLLRVWESVKGNPTLVQSVGGTSVQFFSSGLSSTAATITLTMPNCTGNQVRTININNTGRAIISSAACP